MLQWLILLIVILVLLFIYVFNVINRNENSILFFPPKKIKKWRPKQKYDEIYLNINDNKDICYNRKDKNPKESYIHCWHFNNYDGRPQICFAHGQSGDVTNRSYIIDMCDRFQFNLFLFDYSGFGQSCGKPKKILLRENTETAHNYLHKHCGIPNKEIILWTESLGCISGAYLCSKHEFGGLIISSGFSSLDDLLHNHLDDGYKKVGAKLLTSVLGLQMDFLPVKEYLQQVKCPVVIIHSKEDEIIPFQCAKINFESIKHKNKLFVKIQGGHSSPKIKTRQLRRIFQFCDLPDDNCTSGVIGVMLENLETFAAKHNNFM